jgi:DNA-binding LytR/AlgR family response regulator
MIKAIAIDDEPRALEIIKNHAARIPFLQLSAAFTNPLEALAYINQEAVELVFLDIKMPDISGIELLKSIQKGKILIIFTTAYSEYALESYDLEAIDYLLKPFDFSRFLKSMVKVQERLTLRDSLERDFFFVHTGNQQRKICYSDISYIEGEGNYVTYFVNNEKIIVRSGIKETVNTLPTQLFIQIHRSYIISLRKLDKIQDNHAFIGHFRIPIGANYREAFMRSIQGKG